MTISLIDRTNNILGLISARQEALSSNLANMDTPNYTRKDVDFSQYLGTKTSPLETSLSQKMGASPIMQTGGERRKPEDELAEMQKNSVMYALATKQMTSVINQMKTAINVGSK